MQASGVYAVLLGRICTKACSYALAQCVSCKGSCVASSSHVMALTCPYTGLLHSLTKGHIKSAQLTGLYRRGSERLIFIRWGLTFLRGCITLPVTTLLARATVQ